jgi:hypothetical protein
MRAPNTSTVSGIVSMTSPAVPAPVAMCSVSDGRISAAPSSVRSVRPNLPRRSMIVTPAASSTAVAVTVGPVPTVSASSTSVTRPRVPAPRRYRSLASSPPIRIVGRVWESAAA